MRDQLDNYWRWWMEEKRWSVPICKAPVELASQRTTSEIVQEWEWKKKNALMRVSE